MKAITDFIKLHFLPIAGVIGILISVVSFIYLKGYKASGKDSGNATVVQNQVVMLDSIASFSRRMTSIEVKLGSVIEKQGEAKTAYNSLRLVVLDMASKTQGMTIDQFKQYMESVPELKKNMMFNQVYQPVQIPFIFTLSQTP
jgi:hypothetical protein